MTDYESKVFVIFNKIRKKQDTQLTEETIISDMAVSSIEFIEALIEIEEELNIELEDKELDIGKYNSIKDVLDIIKGKL